MADASSGRLIVARTPESSIGLAANRSKGKENVSVFRGTFNGRPVAVKDVRFEPGFAASSSAGSSKQQFVKECQQLLTLRHENIIRCLDYRLSAEKPNSEAMVIMELCQGNLDDYFDGRMTGVDLKPQDLLWQVASGLEYLHLHNMTHGDLRPCKVLIMKKTEIILKLTGFGILRSLGKKPSSARPADDVLALGEICQTVSNLPGNSRCDPELLAYLKSLVELLKQPKADDRPDSTLILVHPFFILFHEEARDRLMELMMYDKDILVHFNTQELEKWYKSLDEAARKDMKREDYSVLEDLMERFSVDLKVMSLMSKGRREVPRLLSHFVWHSMVIISHKPRITLDEVVGKGAFGTVYRGTWKDKKRNLRAAFKKANFSDGSMKEDRLDHEMEVLRQMDTVFVVKFYGNVKKNGIKLLAMELCEGHLQQYVNDKLFNLPAVDDKMILGQISVALAHIHSRNIVHRDLNPNNILFWRSTSSAMLLVKVAGFASSCRLGEAVPGGEYHGTNGWIAPEILRSDEGHDRANFESDLWVLGLIFYFVLTKGQHPFEIRGADHNVRDVLIKSLKTIPKLEPIIDQWDATDLILRLTDHRPKRRPNVCLVLHHPYFSLSNDVTVKYLAFKTHHFRRFSTFGHRLDDFFDQNKANHWFQSIETELDPEDVVKYQQIIHMWHGGGPQRVKNGPRNQSNSSQLRMKQIVSEDLSVVPKIHDTEYASFRKLVELLKSGPKFFAAYLWFVLISLRLSREEYQKYFQVSQMEYAVIYNTSDFVSKLWSVRSSSDADELTRLFHLATVTSLPKVVTFLLSKNADVTAIDGDGRTALHLAARNSDDPDVLAILLRKGADIHCVNQNNGSTPLHVAAWNNSNPRVIEFLLDNGADVKAVNKCGSTPIHLAAWNNQNPKVIEILLRRGASLKSTNKYGSTPLHLAAWNNRNPKILRTLLDHGADYRALNKYNSTPLHVAALNNSNPEIVKILYEKGPELLKAANKYGSTPLHLGALNNSNPEVLRFLIDKGAELKAVNKFKRTPLHLAARHNRNPDVLRFLLENGADSNSIDRDGKKPVDHASLNGNNPNILKVLLNPDAESDTEVRTRRRTQTSRATYGTHDRVSAKTEKALPAVKRRQSRSNFT